MNEELNILLNQKDYLTKEYEKQKMSNQNDLDRVNSWASRQENSVWLFSRWKDDSFYGNDHLDKLIQTQKIQVTRDFPEKNNKLSNTTQPNSPFKNQNKRKPHKSSINSLDEVVVSNQDIPTEINDPIRSHHSSSTKKSKSKSSLNSTIELSKSDLISKTSQSPKEDTHKSNSNEAKEVSKLPQLPGRSTVTTSSSKLSSNISKNKRDEEMLLEDYLNEEKENLSPSYALTSASSSTQWTSRSTNLHLNTSELKRNEENLLRKGRKEEKNKQFFPSSYSLSNSSSSLRNYDSTEIKNETKIKQKEEQKLERHIEEENKNKSSSSSSSHHHVRRNINGMINPSKDLEAKQNGEKLLNQEKKEESSNNYSLSSSLS